MYKNERSSGQSSPNFINGVKRTVCEVWTRLTGFIQAMGYCRPVKNFNKGKQSEFAERKYFTESKALNHLTSTKEAKDEK